MEFFKNIRFGFSHFDLVFINKKINTSYSYDVFIIIFILV